MSSLIVEVCEIKDVKPHPRADKMAIATVKGWEICIGFNPETQQAQFKSGDKCVYFPPDSILPKNLAESRLGIMKYLKPIPKDEKGNSKEGGIVRAAILRGEKSFGVIMPIDETQGDDPNWEVGTDVKSHFNVEKWEPSNIQELDVICSDPSFYHYTEIEQFNNYPNAFKKDEEVVITEKIHGKTNRIGIIVDEFGNDVFVVGSHDSQRKKEYDNIKRFESNKLIKKGVIEKEPLENDVFKFGNVYWQVKEKSDRENEVYLSCMQVDSNNEPVLKLSEFWINADEVEPLLLFVKSQHENAKSVIAYGELYGAGIQKGMNYGLKKEKKFRLFDVAVNNKYLDFDIVQKLASDFSIDIVPVLYKGKFSIEKVKEYTDGLTTIAKTDQLEGFKGREGVVVKTAKERIDENMMLTATNGRMILKSISADYLSRRNISDEK